MDSFTIKDLENLSGIKAHTIRIWEQRYNVLSPNRTETNIRYYNNKDLKLLLNIALLNKYGFKISHIIHLNDDEISEKVLALTDAGAQHDRLINELIKHMVDLDMDKFENCLDTFIKTKGVEKAVINLIYPFLERIGILWLTSHINPAQEHLVSNIIRQKIIVGIESLKKMNTGSKLFLLFLPEGEHHEMSLLFVYFLLKSRGFEVIYLGANIPLKDVAFVVQLRNPDILYTHLTTVIQGYSLERLFSQLRKQFSDREIIITGRLAQLYEKKTSAPLHLKKSLTEVINYLSAIA